jgi:hypothetical protein
MKTRAKNHWFPCLAGGLLLALTEGTWADPPFGNPPGLVKELNECEIELQACQDEFCAVFPGDGQTGAELAYRDNGDGTFTDLNTGLMWEVKDSYDGVENHDNPHDVDNLYTWTDLTDGDDTDPDGTAFTDFLANLNSGIGFAGHSDWRLPTIKELQSLVDYSVPYPGPTVALELPGATSPIYYWSSTTQASTPRFAWHLFFYIGNVEYGAKFDEWHVRAVRDDSGL